MTAQFITARTNWCPKVANRLSVKNTIQSWLQEACSGGQLDVVRHLVNKWHVDPETPDRVRITCCWMEGMNVGLKGARVSGDGPRFGPLVKMGG